MPSASPRRFIPKASPILAGLATFVCPPNVSAQEDRVFPLEPMVVRAAPLSWDAQSFPYAFSVADQEEVRRARLQLTMAESLNDLPGVFILNPWNFAQDTRIAIRGFGARADFGIRGIRLLVDGIPATTPDGQGEVDGLDLASAESIQVLRGPSTALYGAAAGGVIRIRTEDPPPDPFTELRATVGEDGFAHRQFKAGAQFGDFGYLLSGGRVTSDGFRRHSQTDNRRLNTKWTYQWQDSQRLQLIFNGIDYPQQQDAGGLTLSEASANSRAARDRNVRFDSDEAVRQYRLGLHYEARLREGQQLQATAYYTNRDFANRLPFRNGGSVAYDRTFKGLRLRYNIEGPRAAVSFAFASDYQEDDRRNFDNLDGTRGPLALHQKESVRSTGLSVFARYRLSGQWLLSAALRHDDMAYEVTDRFLADGEDSGRSDLLQWTPSAALTWQAGPRFTFYTNVSGSFEPPTTTELDNPDGGGFNLNLQPQKARQIELGWRFQGSFQEVRWTLQAAAFHIDIADSLVPYELPDSPGREFYRNAGSSTRRGLESSLKARLSDAWTLHMAYTYSDFSFDQYRVGDRLFNGRQLPGIPRHFAALRLTYRPANGFFASFSSHYTGSMPANESNSVIVGDSMVSHLRIAWQLQANNLLWEPFLSVHNLFNTAHFANIRINAFGNRFYEPAPSRRLFAGLRLRF